MGHLPTWMLPASSVAAILLLIAAPTWRSAAWHTRVPSLFAILGIVALTGPAQVRDLVAGTESGGQMLAFPAAVLVTGVGCWFWARWSLNLAGAGGRAGVFDWEAQVGWIWLPRLVALAPAVGALIAIFQGWTLLPFWRGVLLVALTLVVGTALVSVAWGRRRRVLTRRRPWHRNRTGCRACSCMTSSWTRRHRRAGRSGIGGGWRCNACRFTRRWCWAWRRYSRC